MILKLLTLLVIPISASWNCERLGFKTGNSGKMEMCMPLQLIGYGSTGSEKICKGYTEEPKEGFQMDSD